VALDRDALDAAAGVEVGIASFHGLYYTNWPYQMAAAMTAIVPLVLLFFFAQTVLRARNTAERIEVIS